MHVWKPYAVKSIIVCSVFAAACTSTRIEKTTTDEMDLADDFEALGCATSNDVPDSIAGGGGSANIADAGETGGCIGWTLSDQGELTVACTNIMTECGGPQHGAVYQIGDQLILRTYKAPVSTGECDTAACMCPESFTFHAGVSVPEDDLTLVVESGGCEKEKEEELARIHIPAGEIQKGIRCDF